MSEIIVLNKAPVILTKDVEWLNNYATEHMLEDGGVIFLPSDAVLINLPDEDCND